MMGMWLPRRDTVLEQLQSEKLTAAPCRFRGRHARRPVISAAGAALLQGQVDFVAGASALSRGQVRIWWQAHQHFQKVGYGFPGNCSVLRR